MNTVELVPGSLLASARLLYELDAHPYHNWRHVLAVCAALDDWSDETSIAVDKETALAAVGHDIIYDTRRRDNEERSIVLFSGVMEAPDIIDPAIVARVGELIMLTDGHHEPTANDLQAQALIDADYSILGQDPWTYQSYRRAVRKEWAHVSDADFSRGRSAFLCKQLARRHLLYTRFFRQNYEKQAWENIGLELACLPKENP